MSSALGGGIPGISRQQTLTSTRDSEMVMARRTVRQSWNTEYATGIVNGSKRVIGPYRAVTGHGDFLSRENYSCNTIPSSTTNMPRGLGRMLDRARSVCDDTGVPGSSCNPRFVSDSSDYSRFKKHQAINRTYHNLK
jgi:hypothetical protein